MNQIAEKPAIGEGGFKPLTVAPLLPKGGRFAPFLAGSYGTKFRSVAQAQRKAILPELRPEIREDLGLNLPGKRIAKWAVSGNKAAPTNGNSATLINTYVPEGSRLWLEQYYLLASPLTGGEFSYYWEIYVNGIGLLHYGEISNGATATTSPQLSPGRPVAANTVIPFGTTRDQQVLVLPGSNIQVVVIGINASAVATDNMTATLMGSLEGMR